jgi:ribosomal protein S18 acetylase RimI-like enzyme
MNPITFTVLHPEDIDTLLPLARRIWHAHYPGIITIEQIDYMLARGYTREVILDEIEHHGISWIIIKDGMTMIGFISVGPYGDGVMKLHKLYLLPEYHGMGIGSRALAEVERVAKRHNAATLVLNVNRQNQKAISAYQRAGWHVTDEVVIDIGSGYVMNDYVMTKQLA